ncbi:hypothetical protein [Streptomyces sp. NBC_01022]|uniref:hypothetical protein n=1 Tax=Streptomyces sp. NBC_01022 TaxID=2903723 RepID=UPI002DD9D6E1|nr:hypothetical protein [Streptomyces sp. NBC_01022]WRZ84819.1 hypothetical protein OG316_33445 [Streptomyces sp. NBC_01022]
MTLAEAAVPVCTICNSGLFDDEPGYACRPCIERIDRQLRALAGPEGLYARLSAQLAPGAGDGGPTVSGSRTAPVPLRLSVLNLMTAGGPVLGPLETWVRDWEARGRAELDEAGTLQHRLDHAVGTLRFNLAWAAGNHEAIDEFAREVHLMWRACERQITGERPARIVPVACPCGQTIRITLDTAGARCVGCGEQYGHTELMDLPLAERRIAA